MILLTLVRGGDMKTALLWTLLLAGSAALEVKCPTNVTVEEGGTGEIRCQLNGSANLSEVAISKDGSRNIVYRYLNGKDVFREQIAQFKNRTRFSHSDLAKGVVLFWIFNVTQVDEGKFCVKVIETTSSRNISYIALEVVKKGQKHGGQGHESTTYPPHRETTPNLTTPGVGNKGNNDIYYLFILIVPIIGFIAAIYFRPNWFSRCMSCCPANQRSEDPVEYRQPEEVVMLEQEQNAERPRTPPNQV